MRFLAFMFIVGVAFFAALIVLTQGCGNPIASPKQEAGRDAVNKTGTVDANIDATGGKIDGDKKLSTSQPVNIAAGAGSTTIIEQPTVSPTTSAAGGVVMQYAPVVTGGATLAVLFLWLASDWRKAKLNSETNIANARLDLERDKYLMNTLAALVGVRIPAPPTNPDLPPVAPERVNPPVVVEKVTT